MTITKQTTKDEIMAMELHYLYAYNLKDCHKRLTNDEAIVLKFIKTSFTEFEYASDRLKKDREFIKRVIQIDVMCFLYADDSLRKDKKFIMELIEISNARIIDCAYFTVKDAWYEHIKQPMIDYLKNELRKEAKKND